MTHKRVAWTFAVPQFTTPPLDPALGGDEDVAGVHVELGLRYRTTGDRLDQIVGVLRLGRLGLGAFQRSLEGIDGRATCKAGICHSWMTAAKPPPPNYGAHEIGVNSRGW
jgi:hypothetical protein